MSVTVNVNQLSEILHSIGERLDALGPTYQMADDKQQCARKLLAQKHLTETQEKELAALLQEADEIMLRRAEALSIVMGCRV